MAGGEFRFGTDSIYMARHQHRPPESTSAKIWITWLHYGCVSGPIASLFNTIAVFRRGKLGLEDVADMPRARLWRLLQAFAALPAPPLPGTVQTARRRLQGGGNRMCWRGC